MRIVLQELDKLIHEPDAHAFALAQHARLYTAGQSDHACVTGQERAVAAHNEDGDVIGVVVWELDETDDTAWVTLVAVSEAYRRQSVFTQLWARAVRVMKTAGARSVRLGVQVDNEAARAAYELAGLRNTYVIYEARLG